MRSILCISCANKFKEHPDDIAEGWKTRKVQIKTRKPAQHSIEVYAGKSLDRLKLVKTEDVPTIFCDHCNIELPDGTDAVAVSMWRGGEPGNWEKEYSQ